MIDLSAVFGTVTCSDSSFLPGLLPREVMGVVAVQVAVPRVPVAVAAVAEALGEEAGPVRVEVQAEAAPEKALPSAALPTTLVPTIEAIHF